MNKSAKLPQHLISLGLNRNPFPQTPDADSYFRTENSERQYSETLHCVLSGKGFTLLTGEVGTGKSTFLRFLMDDLVKANCAISFVFNTFLQKRDLLLAVNRDFGLPAGADFAEDINKLNLFLIEQNVAGKTCVLVIDDAQNLNKESLELLRLLSNLETRQNKLLQIVLSGQPELLTILAKTEIRQFASRIVYHTKLVAFTQAECARYVTFRISSSGSDGRICLDKNAQYALYRHSKGNPRRVNLIMDRCMYGVLATGQHEISKQLLEVAVSEVGVMPHGSSHRTTINRSIGILAFLGIAVVAWASIPPIAINTEKAISLAKEQALIQTTQTTQPTPPTQPTLVHSTSIQTLPKQQSLITCLEKMGAMNAQNVPDTGILPNVSGSLAVGGLVLVRMPTGSNLPDQDNDNYCHWKTAADTWLLWHPTYPPFNAALGKSGSDVRLLQQQLAVAGFYTGIIDGVVGAHTVDGLNAFRHQQGLSANGNADEWTLFLLQQNLDNLRQRKNHG